MANRKITECRNCGNAGNWEIDFYCSADCECLYLRKEMEIALQMLELTESLVADADYSHGWKYAQRFNETLSRLRKNHE